MSYPTANIGEGLFALGVMIAVGLTKNYYLLIILLALTPIWTMSCHDINNARNKRAYDLSIAIKEEELRLLKLRKK